MVKLASFFFFFVFLVRTSYTTIANPKKVSAFSVLTFWIWVSFRYIYWMWASLEISYCRECSCSFEEFYHMRMLLCWVFLNGMFPWWGLGFWGRLWFYSYILDLWMSRNYILGLGESWNHPLLRIRPWTLKFYHTCMFYLGFSSRYVSLRGLRMWGGVWIYT